MTAKSVAERLAAIRARRDEYLRLKANDDGSNASFWAVLAQAGHFAVKDVPDLLDALEAVLKLADRLDEDADSLRRGVPADAPETFIVERADRCADMNLAAQDLRDAVADALGADTKETAS